MAEQKTRKKRQKYHLSTSVETDKRYVSFMITKGEDHLDPNAHRIFVWFWFNESASGMTCEDLFGNWREHLASGIIDQIDVDIYHERLGKRVRAKKKLQEIGFYEESVEKRDDFLDAMISAWAKYEKAFDERVEKYGDRAFKSCSIPFTCKGIYERV